MLLLTDAGALDYAPCRYGSSRAIFRGPARDTDGSYVVMLGGTQTFGKYVVTPYPALVERVMGQPVVNLGSLGAGPDFYLSDLPLLDVVVRARAAVVQLPGVEAMTNPFYSVHSRRNDRVLAPTPRLRALFPELDFAETHFARHLLAVLQATDSARFGIVVQGLKANWLATMRQLLIHLPLRRVLLSLADTAVEVGGAVAPMEKGPYLVDSAMIAALGGPATRLVTVVPSPKARAMGALGMLFPETEVMQAQNLPGPGVHAEVTGQVVEALAELV